MTARYDRLLTFGFQFTLLCFRIDWKIDEIQTNKCNASSVHVTKSPVITKKYQCQGCVIAYQRSEGHLSKPISEIGQWAYLRARGWWPLRWIPVSLGWTAWLTTPRKWRRLTLGLTGGVWTHRTRESAPRSPPATQTSWPQVHARKEWSRLGSCWCRTLCSARWSSASSHRTEIKKQEITSHARGPSDLTNWNTSRDTILLPQFFHALSCGVVRFVRKNH